MTKLVFTFLLFLLAQGCSLFDSNEIDPELELLTPQSAMGDIPTATIGTSIRIQANMSVKHGVIERYVITLSRSVDNRTALSEIAHDFSDGQDSAVIDTVLPVPSSLLPSQTEREYHLIVSMEYEGGSLGVGQPVILVAE